MTNKTDNPVESKRNNKNNCGPGSGIKNKKGTRKHITNHIRAISADGPRVYA